jgi:3-dehydroquinate synthase
MADSCIGAKCAINYRGFKNQIGAFHSPSRVALKTEFLSTLSDQDVLSGYGEILKLMLTEGEEAFECLVRSVLSHGYRGEHTGGFIFRSLQVKKGIIELDEYEQGLRKILNFGHTFGHALEGATDYAVPHGIAVAWGVDLANFVSLSRGCLEKAWFDRIHRFLAESFLPHVGVPPDPADIFARLRRDKKVREGKVHLILMGKPGDLRIVPTDLDRRLEAEICSYMALNRAQ